VPMTNEPRPEVSSGVRSPSPAFPHRHGCINATAYPEGLVGTGCRHGTKFSTIASAMARRSCRSEFTLSPSGPLPASVSR
jgi:hypothetical protein